MNEGGRAREEREEEGEEKEGIRKGVFSCPSERNMTT